MRLKDLHEGKPVAPPGDLGDRWFPPDIGRPTSFKNVIELMKWVEVFDMQGNFNIMNSRLLSLEGSPKRVWGDFRCYNNQLTSLKGISPYVGGHVMAQDNKIEDLKDVHKHILKMDGKLHLLGNYLNSHFLGVLLVKGCQEVIMSSRLNKVTKIINSFLPNTKGRAGLMDCQEELIYAGYEEFAQL